MAQRKVGVGVTGLDSIIASTDKPATRRSIAEDLEKLGLTAGDTVEVHSSLSSIGYVVGGVVSVVGALIDVVTDRGNIVMPTQTPLFKHPARAPHPPVPDDWVQPIMDAMPPFDPATSPTQRMGAVVEYFRTLPGTYRSNHPLYSFGAWGKDASEIVRSQPLELSLGKDSPLEAIYERDGKVLLLGVGYVRCTTFHHAEYSVGATSFDSPLVPVPVERGNGKRTVQWRPVREICFINDDTITALGEAFEADNPVAIGNIGNAISRLLSQRGAVDYAITWLEQAYKEGRAANNS